MPGTNERDLAFLLDVIDWDGTALSLKPDSEIRAQCKAHADAGLTWVMTGGLHFEEPATFDLVEGARHICRLLDEYGLRTASHHTIVPVFAAPGEDQSAVQDVMRRVVAVCAELGPRSLVFHPGRPAGRHESGAGINATYERIVAASSVDAVIDVARANVRVMGRAAVEHDMFIALENLGRFEPLADLDTVPRLVDAIDEPNVGYCIDSGHAHAFGTPVTEWLDVAGARLFETHFHDNHAGGKTAYPQEGLVESAPSVDEHLPPGFGTIDWRDVIQGLDRIAFAGPVGFELSGWPGMPLGEGLAHAVAWWRTLIRMGSPGQRLTKQ